MFKSKLKVFVLALMFISVFAGTTPVSPVNAPDTGGAGSHYIYIVKSRDSLEEIAKRFGVPVDGLKKLNALKSDFPASGQSLIIPVNSYTVRSGDTLSEISGKYNVTVEAVKMVNELQSKEIMPGQVLAIPAKASADTQEKSQADRPLKDILIGKGILEYTTDIKVIVDKTKHTLTLYYRDEAMKTYPVELGSGGLGDKSVEGDRKTPEGTFYISEKSILNPGDKYLGTRWMRLSYPNIEDANRGLQEGLIDSVTWVSIIEATKARSISPQTTVLGGGIGIHGGSVPEFGKDWTWGCVGLTNSDVEDFYDYVDVGTPVIIRL